MHDLIAGMNALTLWPEWAHGVAHLGKPIENRDWSPPRQLIGQRIAIHAGAHIGGRKGRPGGDEGMAALWRTADAAGVKFSYWSKPDRMASLLHSGRGPIVTGAIVCTAVLARCEANQRHSIPWILWGLHVPPPWGNPASKYWWHLAAVEVLAEPVPAKGSLGLWKWTPEAAA